MDPVTLSPERDAQWINTAWTFKHNQTCGAAGESVDPRDCETHWSVVTEHLNVGTIELQFVSLERQIKLDPFAEKLAGWLKTEAGRSRKQRRTLKQSHADLLVLGLWSVRCGCTVMACCSGAAGDWSRHIRAIGVPSSGSIPFRRERGFCRSGRRAHQAKNLPDQALKESRLSGSCLSVADACPSHNISCVNALSFNGCCSIPIGVDSVSLKANRSAAATTICALQLTAWGYGGSDKST